MRRSNIELWLAFVVIMSITLGYLAVVVDSGSIPQASAFFGHSLGVVGFLLMLMTEVLYSLRKRSRRARWGRMSRWLQFHIFTGLVGPYMVLLHTAWRFNGLAGVLMLLTVVIVASGFFGRYIYTAVPRTADGIELEAGQIATMIAEVDSQLHAVRDTNPGLARGIDEELASLPEGEGLVLVIGRTLLEMHYRRQSRKRKRQMKAVQHTHVRQLEDLLRRRRRLKRQAGSLAAARRLLSVWHAIHIPIGAALFTVAVIHIGAALYYATFLK
ncbi:hypothetical protein ACFLYP_00650 [Chloroflexota bacterium]